MRIGIFGTFARNAVMSNKRIVAIFFEEESRALNLAAELSQAELEPLISRSAEEFHRTLNFQRVDLVVIDNRLPGFLTGLEILERLNNDLLRPPTILLAPANAEIKSRAITLGVEKILAPETTPEATKTAIASVLATRNRSLVVIPPPARKLVLQSDVIQPLPQLLVKICGYLQDQTTSIDDLAKDISVDARITAELLKITNSAEFGLCNKVTKATDAVKFLGIRRTVSLVMTSSVVQMQSGLAKALPEAICKWYYQRSVLIASTAAAFAQSLEDVSSDTAHILGLMQDLGILVMAHGLGPRYQQMVERIRATGQLRLEVAEKQLFDITHADVTAALLLKWDLPQSLISMVVNHHERDVPVTCTKTEERFIHVMRIGEAVANLADKFFPQRYQRLGGLLLSYGAGMGDRCKECLAAGVAKTLESSQLFAIPAPEPAELAALLEKIQAASQEPQAPDGAADAAEMSEGEPKPVVEPKPAVESKPVVGPKSSTSILVIEDELAILEMITEIINSVGLEVLACGDGVRAKELAPRASAILCDFHLQSEKGSDIVRELRRNQFNGPVIFVSSDRTRGTITDCIAAGMSDFLPKPFTSTSLLEKLSKHLGMALAPPAG
jgi:HD-like signal output (HDOD) protein/FixJ family two-component response regulator